MPLATDAVEDRVILLVRKRVGSSELRVKVRGIGRDRSERVVDLVVENHRLVTEVRHRHPAAPGKGHRPVAVEPIGRVDAHGQARDGQDLVPPAGKEIADRALDRGVILPVPVDPQDTQAVGSRGCHPDVLGGAGAGDVAQGKRLSRLDLHRGRDLPSLSQLPRRVFARAVDGHPAPALFAGEVLGADGARLHVREPGEGLHSAEQTVEFRHRISLQGPQARALEARPQRPSNFPDFGRRTLLSRQPLRV